MRLLLASLAALLVLAAPAAAAPVPDGYAYTDEWFDAHDGTQLHAGVFLPADHRPGERHPVIIVMGPYTAPNGGATGATAGGPNADGAPAIRFPELFEDANTKPVHLDVWSALRGPKQAWFGQFTHVHGHEDTVGRRGFLEQAMRFLDRHVRGEGGRDKDPAITVQEGNGDGRWRVEQAWPPKDARRWDMAVRAGGTYADAPGNEADGGPGDGAWSVTRPLPYDAHLAGEPVLKARIASTAPDVNVVAHLYDVAPDGTATFVQRGALAAGEAGTQQVRFALYPQDWRFAKGHRIALRLSGAEDAWFTPGLSGTDVEVLGGSLTLPLLREARTHFVAGGPSDGMDDTSPFALPAETIAANEVGGDMPRRQKGGR